ESPPKAFRPTPPVKYGRWIPVPHAISGPDGRSRSLHCPLLGRPKREPTQLRAARVGALGNKGAVLAALLRVRPHGARLGPLRPTSAISRCSRPCVAAGAPRSRKKARSSASARTAVVRAGRA